MVIVPVAVLGMAAVGGGVWWKHQQDQRAAIAAQLAASAAQSAQSVAQAQERLREQQDIAAIRQQWAAIPRPWTQAAAWPAVIAACMPGPVTIDGWRLAAVDCAVQGAQVNVTQTWDRGPLATVLKTPRGAISSDGNQVVSTSRSPLALAPTGDLPGAPGDAQHLWLGLSQQWSQVLQIQPEAPMPFRPPYPPNTAPDVQKKLPQPVLWNAMPVKLTSAVPPTSWPVLETPNLIPQDVRVDIKPTGLLWTLKGIQYANP
ncbi:pilin accessory protein (PilO) [mine drainage metagenome]|uniref:Pilin accessory protein (PilO) n=1 Tax=mine drainage metagenome TaxID=410659 RepID=A0A1J5PPU9_9ZZZZ